MFADRIFAHALVSVGSSTKPQAPLENDDHTGTGLVREPRGSTTGATEGRTTDNDTAREYRCFLPLMTLTLYLVPAADERAVREYFALLAPGIAFHALFDDLCH